MKAKSSEKGRGPRKAAPLANKLLSMPLLRAVMTTTSLNGQRERFAIDCGATRLLQPPVDAINGRTAFGLLQPSLNALDACASEPALHMNYEAGVAGLPPSRGHRAARFLQHTPNRLSAHK